jgi:hypothetical protein
VTPLAKVFARFLPAALVGPAMALAYGAMLVCVFIASADEAAQNVYVDVRGK